MLEPQEKTRIRPSGATEPHARNGFWKNFFDLFRIDGQAWRYCCLSHFGKTVAEQGVSRQSQSASGFVALAAM